MPATPISSVRLPPDPPSRLTQLMLLGDPPALPGWLPAFDIYVVVHVTPPREPLKAHEARSTWTSTRT